MTTRHEMLTSPRGIWLRRVHNDGRLPAFSYWGGREFGWCHPDHVKLYGTKRDARSALGRILAHEKALGIHRRIGRRY